MKNYRMAQKITNITEMFTMGSTTYKINVGPDKILQW